VAGSGRRDGVPVEGSSDRVARSSRAVLRLEVEAREGIASMASEQRRKHGAGEKNPPDDGNTLLKGGGGAGTQRRGSGSRAMRGAEWGREGGHGGKWLGWPASAPGRRARAVALPRYSGGMRTAQTRATDRRDRVTAGSGGQRWGVGRMRPRDAVLTHGSVAQSAQFNSV
jgi:hypothetical protein